MKKILFGLICFLSITLIPQAETDFYWHNTSEYAYSTLYSGTIDGATTGNYQNSTIKSKGNNNIELKNFKAYDVMMSNAYTISLSGTSTIDYIEQASNSTITLTGSGTLKAKEIGLSMEDMISKKTVDYQNQIKKYVKGDYTLSIDGDYLVFTTKQTVQNTPQKEEPSKNTTTNDNSAPKKDNQSNNSKKEETSNQKEPEVEEEQIQKDLSFYDESTSVKITGDEKIDSNITFSSKDITVTKKEEISKLTEENIYRVYDFSFQKSNEIIKLEKNIKISIQVEEEKEYNVYYYNGDKLLKLESSLNNKELTFNTNHFSEYVITTTTKETNKILETEENVKTSKKETKTIYYIIIGVIIIALITSITIILKKRKTKKHYNSK